MSGHSKWSDIRRELGAEDRARVTAIADRMRFEEELEASIATLEARLKAALGLPPELEIRFDRGPVTPSPADDSE